MKMKALKLKRTNAQQSRNCRENAGPAIVLLHKAWLILARVSAHSGLAIMRTQPANSRPVQYLAVGYRINYE